MSFQVVDVDYHYCQPPMAKKLREQLHATDADFMDNFYAFMRSLSEDKLDGETKEKAIAVAGDISHVLQFTQNTKASLWIFVTR